MKSRTEPLLLRPSDVAAAMMISARTVRRLIAAGQLPAIRLGRSVRIASSDLEAFLHQRRDTAPQRIFHDKPSS